MGAGRQRELISDRLVVDGPGAVRADQDVAGEVGSGSVAVVDTQFAPLHALFVVGDVGKLRGGVRVLLLQNVAGLQQGADSLVAADAPGANNVVDVVVDQIEDVLGGDFASVFAGDQIVFHDVEAEPSHFFLQTGRELIFRTLVGELGDFSPVNVLSGAGGLLHRIRVIAVGDSDGVDFTDVFTQLKRRAVVFNHNVGQVADVLWGDVVPDTFDSQLG